MKAVAMKGVSIALACRAFDVSETVREDVIETELLSSLRMLELTASAAATIDKEKEADTADRSLLETRRALELQIADEDAKLERLTDLLVDGTMDRAQYSARKADCDGRLTKLAKDCKISQQQSISRSCAKNWPN